MDEKRDVNAVSLDILIKAYEIYEDHFLHSDMSDNYNEWQQQENKLSKIVRTCEKQHHPHQITGCLIPSRYLREMDAPIMIDTYSDGAQDSRRLYERLLFSQPLCPGTALITNDVTMFQIYNLQQKMADREPFLQVTRIQSSHMYYDKKGVDYRCPVAVTCGHYLDERVSEQLSDGDHLYKSVAYPLMQVITSNITCDESLVAIENTFTTFQNELRDCVDHGYSEYIVTLDSAPAVFQPNLSSYLRNEGAIEGYRSHVFQGTLLDPPYIRNTDDTYLTSSLWYQRIIQRVALPVTNKYNIDAILNTNDSKLSKLLDSSYSDYLLSVTRPPREDVLYLLPQPVSTINCLGFCY